jgi:dephospho-CoA kinase
MKLLITGQGGSGKTTLGEVLQRRGWSWIDTDRRPDLFIRETRDPGTPYNKVWRPDWGWREARAGLLEAELNRTALPLVVTGIYINQFATFPFFDRVIWLSTTDETMFGRVLGRDGARRDQAELARWARNRRLMERWSIEAGAERVDANRPSDAVLTDVFDAISMELA